MSIDINDPYGFSMSGLGLHGKACWPSFAGGSICTPEGLPVQDPIAYAAKHTNLSRSQIEQMAAEDPDRLRQLLFSLRGGAVLADVNRAWQRSVGEETAMQRDIREMAIQAAQTANQIVASHYLAPGSRYTLAESSMDQQQALEAAKQRRARMQKYFVAGAIVLGILLLR